MRLNSAAMRADFSFALYRLATRPELLLAGVFLVVLGTLVLGPLIEIIRDAITYQSYDLAYRPDAKEGEFTWFHLERVFASDLTTALFLTPLLNSLAIGVGVTVLGVTVGTLLAWLFVRTDLRFKGFCSPLVIVPYMMPSWVLALAWLTVFKNDRLGGAEGMVSYFLGVQAPDWLSYGMVPILICLALHYYAYAFFLMSGALMTMDSELEEAGAVCGLSRSKRMIKITFPLLLPALGSAIVLTFIRVLGTFGTPALLGLPVRFFTFSTQIYASLNSRNWGDGFVLALVLVVIAVMFIYVNTRILGIRKSFVTVTGKGFRQRPIKLGVWRTPLSILVAAFIVSVVILPLILLAWESLLLTPGVYSLDNFTLHYWIGVDLAENEFADPGVLHNDQILTALWNSLRLGLVAALFNGFLGLLVGYAVVRARGTLVSRWLEGIAFAPYIFPSIALGAIYLGMFSTSLGPLPPLYGTFALLVLITIVKNLPFTSRTGIAAIHQIDKSLEEAARVQGIGWIKRMTKIIVPMSTSGLTAGMVLTFISAARELSLIILLVTPSTQVMSGLIFGYHEQDQTQHSGAVTLILVLMIISVSLLARRLTEKSSMAGLRSS